MKKITIDCPGSVNHECNKTECVFNHDVPEGLKCVLADIYDKDLSPHAEIVINIKTSTSVNPLMVIE